VSASEYRRFGFVSLCLVLLLSDDQLAALRGFSAHGAVNAWIATAGLRIILRLVVSRWEPEPRLDGAPITCPAGGLAETNQLIGQSGDESGHCHPCNQFSNESVVGGAYTYIAIAITTTGSSFGAG